VRQDQFDSIFGELLATSRPLLPKERLALDLFNASFFQPDADTRLLTLVMSIEALCDPQPRSKAAVSHVHDLLSRTEHNVALARQEKDSLIGSLKWLLSDSIRQTALMLVERYLSGSEYAGMTARKFFDLCYGQRSALVHGTLPQPSHSEVGHAAANLEVLVSDLLMSCLSDASARASG
jgi:hypothetical protein